MAMQVHPLPGIFEPVGSLTHLGGALIFAILAVFLVRRARGDSRRVVFLSVYAVSCVLLLSMSGLFHMLPEGSPARAILGRLDRASIFILIAGTHTPVHGMFFRGVVRWGGLIGTWMLAALGIVLFTTFYDRMPPGLGASVYLILGWIAVGSGLAAWRRIQRRHLALLVTGGLVYSIGAILLILGWPNLVPRVLGPHEFWHFAVLAGMGFHWTFLFQHADRPIEVLSCEPGWSARTAA